MRTSSGDRCLFYSIFLLLLICNLERISGDVSPADVKSIEPYIPTIWERFLSGVRKYPWKTNVMEKESPENAKRRSLLWQRLTMSTVL
ncbi:uncharacterized protein LOC26526851 [Drosophila erecta]|uniref:Uncharacterized protein n=1 Tax=Drosophila erecta TaxID=7220 RepID=A0A0Q5UHG5_DROER|nr:uncharacterized protein LOC26526851 [Drosophila erecta]KQS44291.1 uncharacterized protein Dere_GG27027 [Drosophila erecta]